MLTFWFAVVSYPLGASAESTLLANFDALAEGFIGPALSTGGILFTNLNTRDPHPENLYIETTAYPFPGLSPSNYLTSVAFAPGPASGFGKFASLDISFSGTATLASLDIMHSETTATPNNKLTLEATYAGRVVASDSVDWTADALQVAGLFDALKLIVSGTDNNGTMFFGIDNVMITIVPEPSSLAIVSLASFILWLCGIHCKPCNGRGQTNAQFEKCICRARRVYW